MKKNRIISIVFALLFCITTFSTLGYSTSSYAATVSSKTSSEVVAFLREDMKNNKYAYGAYNCLRYISDVFGKMGFDTRYGLNSAIDYWRILEQEGKAHYDPLGNVPIGADVFFDTTNFGPWGHVGIYIGDGTIIHDRTLSSTDYGVVEQKISDNSFYTDCYLGWAWHDWVTIKDSPFNHCIDSFVSDSPGKLHLSGWIYNIQNSDASIQIHIYLDAPAGSGQLFDVVEANLQRNDVNSAFGISGRHGFDKSISVSSGSHTFYLYAVDQYKNVNAPLGPDAEKQLTINMQGSTLTTTSDRLIDDGDYIIANTGMTDKSNFSFLDIPGTNQNYTYGSAALQTYVPSNAGNVSDWDTWTVKYDSSKKYYKIKQKGTNMAMTVDIPYCNMQSASVLAEEDCSGDFQYWKIETNGKDGYTIQAYCSGFVLDVKGGGCVSGTGIQQWPANGSPAQSWLFIPYNPSQPIENGRYVIFSELGNNIELDIADDDNARIWNADETSHSNTFDFTKLSNGYYKIKHVATGKCLDVTNGVSSYSTNVRLFADNDSLAQQFAVIPSNGGYIIVSRCNGYALDITGGSAANGTNIGAHPISKQSHQLWRIVPEEAATCYIIIYDANGGIDAPATETISGGATTLSSKTPTRTGYNFLGWGLSADAQEATYQAGDSYSGGAVTLYAIWQIKNFTVSFDSNGAEVYESRHIDYGEAVGELPEPSKTSQFFKGWFDAAGNKITAETIVYENISLTARWSSVTKMILPSAITAIEDEAFEGVDTNAFVIPSNVSSIGARAFASNSNLYTVIVLSRNVTPAADAFDGCPNLTIYGYENSAIYYYAAARKIPFVALSGDSGWIEYSDLPIGATITGEKWTYTETIESADSSMAGWELTEQKWRIVTDGVWTYANYPSGFNKNHALYDAHNKAALPELEENGTTKRVAGVSAINSYIFWQWAYTDAGYVNEEINDFEGSDGRNEYHLFHAFETTESLDGDRRGMTKDGTEKSYDNIWSTYHYPQYGQYGPWWWWRLTVYKQDYTDYEKVNVFTRQGVSSTEVQPEDNITNVQHWVTYSF